MGTLAINYFSLRAQHQHNLIKLTCCFDAVMYLPNGKQPRMEHSQPIRMGNLRSPQLIKNMGSSQQNGCIRGSQPNRGKEALTYQKHA